MLFLSLILKPFDNINEFGVTFQLLCNCFLRGLIRPSIVKTKVFNKISAFDISI